MKTTVPETLFNNDAGLRLSTLLKKSLGLQLHQAPATPGLSLFLDVGVCYM